MARIQLRRVLLRLFAVCFLLLISFVVFGQQRTYHLDSIEKKAESFKYQVKSFADNYTHYTVDRLGLEELKGIEALESDFGPVINDVTSFQYSINNVNVCQQFGEANRTLLVMVVSAPDNSLQRQIIRQTWARTLNESQHFGHRWARATFLIGSADSDQVQEDIINESRMYGDVIQIKMKDEYSKLSLKSVALLHWSATFCPHVHFILKCDDDIFVNVRRLSSVMEQIHSFNGLYGTGKVRDEPNREMSSKYFVSLEVWPWPTYPAYLFGGAYIMGRDAIRHLLAAAQTTPYFAFEDVYLTGICTKKANISIYASDLMYSRQVPKRVDPCAARNIAMWMTKSTDQLLELEQDIERVYEQNIDCSFDCNYLRVC